MKLLSGIFLLLLACNLQARSTADYLPADADPDPAIPTPESILGWEVGDWHVSHDKLVHYMQALAAASPRVSLKVTGHTYEQRPLLLLAITSEANQQNLEELRQAHLDGDGPLVAWLGYSVHGNEASGSNAALLAAYYLASSRSEFVEQLLSESVVLLDPSVNPDGLNRFASWANHNAARMPVGAAYTRQRMEHWPGARTNHYWFDLNRDWLPLVHPESRARIVEYHRWRPHVLTDHHEQGRLPGFFFQPGVPSRQNPLTPDENLELTRALATYHAAAMDEAGEPYFTEEAYDDFYFGKGSTYPDIHGTIGILFEQRSIRGQQLDTSNGVETFRMAIANQLRMSLSTLTGAWEIREGLKGYQAAFYGEMRARAASRDFAGWVIGDDGDPARGQALMDVFAMHEVEFSQLTETVRANGQEFHPGHAWVIPAAQDRFGLVEGMLEQRTQFANDTFYDVSAWTLPLAYNLPFATLPRLPSSEDAVESSRGIAPREDALAWVFSWNQLEAPALLQKLLVAGARVRTAIKPFTARTDSGLQPFQPGAILVQSGIQEKRLQADIQQVMADAALQGLKIASITSTLTPSGPDLGSINFPLLREVKPLILGGEGVTSYDAGEQWFLLDHRLGVTVPVVEMTHFRKIDLGEYTHILMADGSYKGLGKSQSERITRWVIEGGTLLTSARAANWAEKLCFDLDTDACDEGEEEEEPELPAGRAYADFDDDQASQVIGGAIVSGIADLSHPIAFGYQRPDIPLFRRGAVTLEPSFNPYSTPVRYTNDPLMAGFIGEERLEAMRGQPAVIAERQGEGLVVRFANTPLFRGFWRGTERLFINALYFGQVIRNTDLPEISMPPKPEVPRDK